MTTCTCGAISMFSRNHADGCSDAPTSRVAEIRDELERDHGPIAEISRRDATIAELEYERGEMNAALKDELRLNEQLRARIAEQLETERQLYEANAKLQGEVLELKAKLDALNNCTFCPVDGGHCWECGGSK